MQIQVEKKMITENYVINSGLGRTGLRQGILSSFSRSWMGLALLATDMLSLALAILIAMQIRHLPDAATNSAYDGIFIVLGATLMLLFYRKGLYPGVGMHYVEELSHIVSSCSVAFLIMIGVTFLFQTTAYYSRLVLTVTTLLCLFFIPVGRYLTRRALIRLKLWGEPVAIIGLNDRQKA